MAQPTDQRSDRQEIGSVNLETVKACLSGSAFSAAELLSATDHRVATEFRSSERSKFEPKLNHVHLPAETQELEINLSHQRSSNPASRTAAKALGFAEFRSLSRQFMEHTWELCSDSPLGKSATLSKADFCTMQSRTVVSDQVPR